MKKIFLILPWKSKMKKKQVFNIAIVGLGNIGAYLYNFLNKNKIYLSNKNNVAFKIAYVCAKNIRKKRKVKIKKKQWIKNYKDIISKKMLILLLN